MLTRLPSVPVNETYLPTPGISIGSPSTVPPAWLTVAIKEAMLSTAMCGPIGLSRNEPAVDRTRCRGTTIDGLCGGGKNVVAHVGAQRPNLPTEGSLVKGLHTRCIVVWHFEVDNWVHEASDVLDGRCVSLRPAEVRRA